MLDTCIDHLRRDVETPREAFANTYILEWPFYNHPHLLS
jgi:hypothetical protein